MDSKTRWLAAACTAAALLACNGWLQAATKPMQMQMPAAATATAQKSRATTALAQVDDAWVRAAPPGTTMLAGYMDIHNPGRTPLRLLSARSDAFGMVELHRSQIVDGVSSMRAAGEQDIPAGSTLRIRPGGLHWMLMQPGRVLKVGDSVHFILHFATGGDADVVATVRTGAP